MFQEKNDASPKFPVFVGVPSCLAYFHATFPKSFLPPKLRIKEQYH